MEGFKNHAANGEWFRYPLPTVEDPIETGPAGRSCGPLKIVGDVEVTMFCPKCGAEYTADATECVDCLVPLVKQAVERKPPPGDPGVELVTVFESANPALIALAKSLLDSAEIEFATKGDTVQDLIGLGRFPGGLNTLTGPVAFMVRAEDAKQAGSLLHDLQHPEQDEGRESA